MVNPHKSYRIAIDKLCSDSRYYLINHLGLLYAPSCQLLQLTQKHKRSDFSRLFAIQDPEQKLLFANSVVETIRHYFPGNAQIIVREEASKETLNNATCESGGLRRPKNTRIASSSSRCDRT